MRGTLVVVLAVLLLAPLAPSVAAEGVAADPCRVHLTDPSRPMVDIGCIQSVIEDSDQGTVALLVETEIANTNTTTAMPNSTRNSTMIALGVGTDQYTVNQTYEVEPDCRPHNFLKACVRIEHDVDRTDLRWLWGGGGPS